MTKHVRTILAALALTAPLAACGGPKTDIGLVDVQRVAANWPKFQNAQNQLAADQQTLAASKQSPAEKQRAAQALQQRYAQVQSEISNDVSEAAKQVAGDKHLKYVLTRQFIGYGGVDITPDVMKVLHIEEKATPKP